MKRLTAAAVAAALLPPASSAAGSLPIGFEAKGGFGAGYYSMSEFNKSLQEIREDLELNFSDLTSGFTVLLEGRVWVFGRIAGCAGYEHFWAEQIVPTGSSTNVTYKAPADLLSLGGVVHIFRVPTVLDVNIGLKGSFTKVIYGTDQSGRFVEYKANDYGWDIFGEINTNFMNPVQVGFTLGYRSVKVEGFEDKFGNEPVFMGTGDPVTMNFSGVYIYFTAGVAVW